MLATGCLLAVESLLVSTGAGSQSRGGCRCLDWGTLPFPWVRAVWSERLNAANLPPFLALFLICGLCSCEVLSAS